MMINNEANLVLPQNNEAEQAVLGAILIDNSVMNQVMKRLSTNDFYSETHRIIYSIMTELYSDSRPIDLLTLFDELKTNCNSLEKIGGSSYLTYLMEIIPATEHVEYYANLVKQVSEKRQLSEVCTKVDHELRTGKMKTDVAIKLINKVISGLPSLSNTDHYIELISLTNHKSKPMSWLVENILPDGFPTVIYGEGGKGKSLVALFFSILVSLGRQNFIGLKLSDEPRNVLYLDYELNADETARRALQISLGLGLSKTPENLFYLSPKENLERCLRTLQQKIGPKNIKFVVIDSLGASGVNGESVPDVVNIFNQFRELGITILIIDHQAKLQANEKYSHKTPYGSVYKYNLSRSVLQLACIGQESNRITLVLKHTKSNFGNLVDDVVFDVSFEGNRIRFFESNIKDPEELFVKQIYDAIKKLTESGTNVNQKILIAYFKAIIGRDRLIVLLQKYEGELWETVPGKGKEKIYRIITLKTESIYNQRFRVLNSDRDEFEVPEVIK